jgi:hypothetical protein
MVTVTEYDNIALIITALQASDSLLVQCCSVSSNYNCAGHHSHPCPLVCHDSQDERIEEDRPRSPITYWTMIVNSLMSEASYEHLCVSISAKTCRLPRCAT